MSFQAYLDNIYRKTGVTADEFKAMAREKGLDTHADILTWLKSDFDLGTGHARAIADVVLHEDEFRLPEDERVAKHFAGRKSRWRTVYDDLLERLTAFGPDVADHQPPVTSAWYVAAGSSPSYGSARNSWTSA